jgi:hypothetical protein
MGKRGRPKKEAAPMVKTTLRVPEAVWRAARIRAVEERRTFQDVLADALTMYLKTALKRREKEGGR